jgi:AcrR family transcriptional regulator
VNPAPYLRIAEDIRTRITTGRLKAGDRVPSARQITAEWGVAIATATRALAALQQQGLVRPVPGVGTVVTAREPTPPPPAAARRVGGATAANARAGELSRDRIVRAAIDLVDAEGISALSMRAVAARLDAATMSLYRYVPSKDELIFLMIDEAIGEERFPAEPPDGWRAMLELEARLQWAGFRRHPWLGPVMSVTRPQLAPNALIHMEWSLRALDGLGLDPTATMHVHVTLFCYVRGLATSLESETEAEFDSGMSSDEWMQTQSQTLRTLGGSGLFATFMNLVEGSDIELDLDSLFEFGLARLLDGLEAFIARQSTKD